MRIVSVHERSYKADAARLGEVLASLSSAHDRLWPAGDWPPLRLDLPLGQGGRGGHSPVHYREVEYEPGRRVRFDFEPAGLLADLRGGHEFEILPGPAGTVLRHRIDASCGFGAWLKWALIVRPLHDALLRDALDKVELELAGSVARKACWSPWVRLLRKTMLLLSRRRAGDWE
jgi:hypothetical protein